MKFRGPLWNTLWLILIFIGLGLYLALVEVPNAEKKDQEATRSKLVVPFKVEEVEEFDLIKKSGTIQIKRNPNDSTWNISKPLSLKGDDGIINHLLLTVEEAKITRVVDEAPQNLADFGLQDPSLKIALRFKSKESKILLVGELSPLGRDTYIKLADEERVLLSFLDTRQLNASLNDLRNKTLLDFTARDVTSVDLTYEGKAQRFVKKGEHWNLTAPVNARGDTDEILNFLNNIRFERIENFISETPEEAAPLGLTQPRIILNIKAEKAGRAWTLRIGKKYDDHSYYAQRAEPHNIVTLSDSLVETLSRNPLSFIEKSLLTFQEENITGIESRAGRDTVHVVRDPNKTGQWIFANPEAEPADSATVNTLLLDLKEARIQEFAPSKNLKLFGLDAPRNTLTIFKSDGSKETLRLGNPDRGKKYYFVARSADLTVFKLGAETVAKIFRSQLDFTDKKLLKFEPEQVTRIEIKTPEKTFELSKIDNQWVLVKPEKIDDIKPFVGKDILWTLNNLEYEAKMDSKEVTDETGLEKPRLTITLNDQKNQPLGQIKIGQPVKNHPLLYSSLPGDPALYHIKDRTLGEIPTTLDRFRKNED